jgi:hypothetical protein
MAMTLRTTHTQDVALERLAQAWGVSKQAAALRAIEEADARVGGLRAVAELGRRSLQRWGEAYDELARS